MMIFFTHFLVYFIIHFKAHFVTHSVKVSLKTLTIALTLLLLSLPSCNKKNRTEQSDEVRAQLLIDENNEDEAITILEEKESQGNISRSELKVLASAYAHKAGIKMIDFINIFKKNQEIESTAQKTENSVESNQSKQIISKLHNLLKSILVFKSLPHINDDQWASVKVSLNIYQSLDNKTSDEYLFMVLLQITKLKYTILNKFQNNGILNKEVLQSILGNILLQVSEIYVGLSKVSMAKSTYYTKLAQDSIEMVDKIPAFIEVLCKSKIDTEIFLSTLKELGFQYKDFSCGS